MQLMDNWTLILRHNQVTCHNIHPIHNFHDLALVRGLETTIL